MGVILTQSLITARLKEYGIQYAALFDGSTGYLSRTPVTTTNRKTFTLSFWVYKCENDAQNVILSSRLSTGYSNFQYRGDDNKFEFVDGNVGYGQKAANEFRDNGAWTHVVYWVDTTAASVSDRSGVYINGVEGTDYATTGTALGLNVDTEINHTWEHNIGRFGYLATGFLDGYLAEVHFFDGVKVPASEFGKTKSNGNWVAKKYEGAASYGTNGFYLDFSNSADLGLDVSQGANWGRSVSLLMHMDGFNGSTTYSDDSLNGHTCTAYGNAQIDTAQSKFGGASGLFDGNGDYVSVPDNVSLDLQSEAFNIEFWYRFNAIPNYSVFLNKWTSSGNQRGWYLQHETVGANSIRFGWTADGSSGTAMTWPWSPSIDTWYHIAVSRDANGVSRCFIDGTEIGSSSTALNGISIYNSNQPLLVGCADNAGTPAYFCNGWMDDLRIVKGGAVYTDNFSVPTVPHENPVSGNHWALNGTVTQVTSTPTNTAATLNSLVPSASNYLSKGNRKHTNGNDVMNASTMSMTSGLWKAQVYVDSYGLGCNAYVGVVRAKDLGKTGGWNYGINSMQMGGGYDGVYANWVSPISGGLTFTTGDMLDLIWNADTGNLKIYKNNEGTATFNVTNSDWVGEPVLFYAVNSLSTGSFTATWSFSEDDWAYTAQDGANALTTDDLLDNSTLNIDGHFKTVLYTGNGGSQTISSGLPAVDFAWIKKRNGAERHEIVDSVRGDLLRLSTDRTDAEIAGGVTFNGGDLDLSGGYGSSNENAFTYAAWCANLPSDETNSDGDITVTWKYNATLGMAVGTYTGNGTAGQTIGLPTINGTAPKFITWKNRSSAGGWEAWHNVIGASQYLQLNTTAAAASDGGALMNNTVPTSSVITLGSGANVNANTNNHLIIVFWETDLCKIGSYTGNGSTDGPFVNMEGQPVWTLTKNLSGNGWYMEDTVRSPYNPSHRLLYAHLSNAEATSWTGSDYVSNGRKLRNIDGGNNSSSSNTYIYLAFVQPNGSTENTGR
ncbi:LamG-like jellyroll fold domain-containing protein [Magnetovibrio sp. PR-2]|uniref:DUF7483 domain-containing protein n=1 Tax=Magnetovibrio sp. PR-2 TaxID=3120356 RepID=UPI002FCDF4E4